MPGTKKKESGYKVKVQAIRFGQMDVLIRGLSPLLQNKPADRIVDGIIENQGERDDGQKATKERAPRIPEQIAREALWVINEKKKLYGINAIAVWRSLTETAVRQLEGSTLKMIEAKGALQIPCQLIPIMNGGSKPATWVLDSQMVKPNFKTTTIAHRPRFDEWSMTIPVRWNLNKLTKDDITQLFRISGFNGIGCHRGERNGTNGMFEVVGVKNYREVSR